MWFFSPPSLCVLRRNGIDLYQNGGKIGALPFSDDIVSMLEVHNPEKLGILLSAWVRENKLQSKKIIILLSPGMIFRKKTPRDPKRQDKELLKEFAYQIPLSPSEKQLKLLQTAHENYFFATNASILRVVRDTLSASHTTVFCAVPIELFGIGGEETSLSQVQLKKILRATQLQAQGNFFGETITTTKPMKRFFFF